MSNSIKNAVLRVLDVIGREPLKKLRFTPILPEDVDWNLARLSRLVPPAYLPFATDSFGILTIYLRAGQAIDYSPIIYISTDDLQELYFVSDKLANLPAGLWLLVGRYFKDNSSVLREAVSDLALNIPKAQAVPEALWKILEESPQYEPTLWNPQCSDFTAKAWELASVGHPFLGLPRLSIDTRASEAVQLLEPYVRLRRKPKLLDLLISAQIKAGVRPARQDVITLLSEEAWLGSDCLMRGRWRVKGKGMCVWDSILRNLPVRDALLKDSYFEILSSKSMTYSGEDRHGPLTLVEIGKQFCSDGNYLAAVSQFRNAMLLAILSFGKYPSELAVLSASECDSIRTDSLASQLARYMAEIDRDDL